MGIHSEMHNPRRRETGQQRQRIILSVSDQHLQKVRRDLHPALHADKSFEGGGTVGEALKEYESSFQRC